MKTQIRAIALLLFFFCVYGAQAQDSRFRLNLQTGTQLYNPTTVTELRGDLILCNTFLCVGPVYEIDQVRTHTQQLSLDYQLSRRWSFESGLLFTRLKLDGTRSTVLLPPGDNTEQRSDRFTAWQIPLQINYQPYRWWQLGLGYRLPLGKRSALVLDNGFSSNPRFEVRGSVLYLQSRFWWTITEKFRLGAALQANYADQFYLESDVHLEGSLGISFQW